MGCPPCGAVKSTPTWTTLGDDVRRQVLGHLDLAECAHMAASSKDGRALVDSLASRHAVLTGVPTVCAAQDMLAARVPRVAISQGVKTPTQGTSQRNGRKVAAAVPPSAEARRPGSTPGGEGAMGARRVPQGSASKAPAVSTQPAERIAMRPLALVQANLLGWPDLRQVLRREHSSAEAKQMSFFRALHLYAVARVATKVLGARFITRSDADLRRVYQRRDYPYFGSPACRQVCAAATVAGGMIVTAAAAQAIALFPHSWIGVCCFTGGVIAYQGALTGLHFFIKKAMEDERSADSWMTEAVWARDMGSKAHGAMCEEFWQASRGLQTHLDKLDKSLADIVLRRIDHLGLDKAKIGQCPGDVGNDPHWQRCCEVYANKINEVSACLEELHQFSAAQVQPLFV